MKPAYKLCVCLGDDWRTHWYHSAAAADLVELRIDLMFPNGGALSEIAEALAPLLREKAHKIILTCRLGAISQEERRDLFLAILSTASPAYLDLEYNTPQSFRAPLYAAAQQHNAKIIASFHDLHATPELSQLYAIADEALCQGADLVKIVTCCNKKRDASRLMSLYQEVRFANRIIAFGLGKDALASRLEAAKAGAPILYVSSDGGAPTAVGQPSFSVVKERLTKTY